MEQCRKSDKCFRKSEVHGKTFVMTMIAPPLVAAVPEGGNSLAKALYAVTMSLMPLHRSERKNAAGGPHNPLKMLIPAKEIKGNRSLFLGEIWPGLSSAWLDFAKFGVGFGKSTQCSPLLPAARADTAYASAKTPGPWVAKPRLDSHIRARSAAARRTRS
jgi:hypothetical protein